VSSKTSKPSSVSVNPAPVTLSTGLGEVSNTAVLDTAIVTLEQARAMKGDTDTAAKAAALDKLVEHLTGHPDASVSELARLINRSRTTVYSYLDELEAAGKVHRNGQVTVLDSLPS
jgi:hypothetical protein